MPALYDTIGVNSARRRKADPRIRRAIHGALGKARSILNVGAGAGSYEPNDRTVFRSFQKSPAWKKNSPVSTQTSAPAHGPGDTDICLRLTISTAATGSSSPGFKQI